MSLRSAENLDCHPFPQNGEGMCWTAFVEGHLISSKLVVPERKELVKILGARKKDGTEPSRIVSFLENEYGISWYAEADCPMERLLKLVEGLPKIVDIAVPVFDARPRPGYPPRKDKTESHILAALFTGFIGGEPVIRCYDFDTVIGGPKTFYADFFELWRHDGHGAVVGENRRLNIKDIDKLHDRSFISFGAGAEEIWNLVGEPE